MVGEVYINLPVKSIANTYTYTIPDNLNFLERGYRVLVSFGGRKVEGFLVAVREIDPVRDGQYKLKDIIDAVDDEPWFTREILAATKVLADFYLCSVAEMMRLFMPGKSGLKITTIYALTTDEHKLRDDAVQVMLSLPPYRDIYQILEDAPRSIGELKKELSDLGETITVEVALERLQAHQICYKDYLTVKREKIAYDEFYVRTQPITDELLSSLTRKRAQIHALSLYKDCEELSYNYLQAHARGHE